MASDPENTTPANGRISVPAALGALGLVVAAVVFGVLGPRMGQRGIRLGGTPLSEIRDVAIDLYGIRLLGGTSDLEGPGEGFSQIEGLGFESRGSEIIDLNELGPASSHWFEHPQENIPVLVLELADASRFIYFDQLGRQRPLLAEDRILEKIGLESVAWVGDLRNSPYWARPRFEEVLEDRSLGTVILGLGDQVVLIVAPTLQTAEEIADRIVPELEPDEGGEVAMEGYPWGSGWSDEPGRPVRPRLSLRDTPCDLMPSVPSSMSSSCPS